MFIMKFIKTFLLIIFSTAVLAVLLLPTLYYLQIKTTKDYKELWREKKWSIEITDFPGGTFEKCLPWFRFVSSSKEKTNNLIDTRILRLNSKIPEIISGNKNFSALLSDKKLINREKIKKFRKEMLKYTANCPAVRWSSEKNKSVLYTKSMKHLKTIPLIKCLKVLRIEALLKSVERDYSKAFRLNSNIDGISSKLLTESQLTNLSRTGILVKRYLVENLIAELSIKKRPYSKRKMTEIAEFRKLNPVWLDTLYDFERYYIFNLYKKMLFIKHFGDYPVYFEVRPLKRILLFNSTRKDLKAITRMTEFIKNKVDFGENKYGWELYRKKIDSLEFGRGLSDNLKTLYPKILLLRARWNLFMLANKILKIHQTTGTFPGTLDIGNGSNFIDPFTGSPLIYKKIPGGFKIYSTGPDGKNHGGGILRSDTRVSPGEREFDIGYTFQID